VLDADGVSATSTVDVTRFDKELREHYPKPDPRGIR
jgi:hypothetical protein